MSESRFMNGNRYHKVSPEDVMNQMKMAYQAGPKLDPERHLTLPLVPSFNAAAVGESDLRPNPFSLFSKWKVFSARQRHEI